jgi:hypothetical protein
MFKFKQGLTLQKSPKHLGVVSKFLQGTSTTWFTPLGINPWKLQIFGSTWMLGYLDSWRNPTWSTQTCPCQAYQAHPHGSSSSSWKQKEMWERFFHTEGVKAAEDLENLLMAIFQIDLVNRSVTIELYVFGQSQFKIYFRLFLESDLVFQSYQRCNVSWFR